MEIMYPIQYDISGSEHPIWIFFQDRGLILKSKLLAHVFLWKFTFVIMIVTSCFSSKLLGICFYCHITTFSELLSLLWVKRWKSYLENNLLTLRSTIVHLQFLLDSFWIHRALIIVTRWLSYVQKKLFTLGSPRMYDWF